MPIPDRFRFTLTKRQVEDLEDHLLFDGARFAHLGVEQPDGGFLFDIGYEELEDLTESVASAYNIADDEQAEARLDAIYKKLVRVLGAEG